MGDTGSGKQRKRGTAGNSRPTRILDREFIHSIRSTCSIPEFLGLVNSDRDMSSTCSIQVLRLPHMPTANDKLASARSPLLRVW